MSQPFGFGMGAGGPDPNRPFDLASLGAALQQLGAMLQQPQSADEGPVRWALVRDVARQAIAAAGDPVVSDAQRRAIDDAARLADLWLDEATTLPASIGSPRVWSRSEWIEATMPAWQRIVAPVAEAIAQIGGAEPASPEELLAQLPEQLRAMLPPEGIPPQVMAMMGPMLGMARQMGAMAFSQQLGQSIAALAQEVTGAADIGIPLTDDAAVALLPRNAEALADDLELPRQEVLVHAALREAAHQRLFAHVPWLRARMLGAVEEYARGVSVDPARLQSLLGGADLGSLDPSDPEALQRVLAEGVMAPEDSPEQRAAIARLETLLACVEGWVEDVVDQAARDRLPSAAALRETVRRRRAAGGPAERAFASLVGMELRPRLVREAGAAFAALRSLGSVAERDALWSHPDLLPTADDLADPLGFVERARAGASSAGAIGTGAIDAVPDDLSGLDDAGGV